MPASLYDQLPYHTFPRRQTHPERLAAVGMLFGMSPAPATRCRVLEIGCGTGGNLVPLAFSLPESRFLGIDLAAKPIGVAREDVSALELTNIEFRVCDLRELNTADGPFDYILAHGLYSWVLPEVRLALLAACRALLTSQGIAFISYNAYPGSYERQMFREMLLHRGGDLSGARDFLRTLPHPEAAALADSSDDILFHDILAPCYQPSWFHQFASQAKSAQLQYLGEADPHEMFDETGRLTGEAGEQELDFRKLRRFRQSLVCRAELPLKRTAEPEQMDSFLFSKNRHGRRLPGEDPAVEAVAQALEDTHPLPAAFEELIPYAGSRQGLREILLSFVAAGCADLHTHYFPCEESVTRRPQASRLARHQALASPTVTNLCHGPVQLDEVARQLLLLLDGTRTQQTVARQLAAQAGAGSEKEIRRALPASLAWLAQMALLEA